MSTIDRCFDLTVHILTFTDIFTPINIEFKYDTIQKISQQFSNSCVALDPRLHKSVSTKVTFQTGCKGERCYSDLAIVGNFVNVTQPYVLGSTKTIKILYEITNTGEPAYWTQIRIMIPENVVQFSKFPLFCEQESNTQDVICSINGGKPVINGGNFKFEIDFDATNLEGKLFKVVATVFSAGDETNSVNNRNENDIMLREFSDLDIIG